MELKKWFIGIIVFALCFSGIGKATFANSELDEQLDEVQATEKYKDVKVAIADGYVEGHDENGNPHFVSHPELGGMGVHFSNEQLIVDAELDPLKPEVLVYEPIGNGEYKLVAVEYMSLGEERPSMFGQEFDDGPLDGSFALHAWIWKENPSGVLASFNPNVTGEIEGMELPDTASNAHNSLLIGLFLLMSGAIFFLYQRRKQNV